jgi:hypothetical protein
LAQAGLSALLYDPRIFALTKYVLAVLFRIGWFLPSESRSEADGILPDSALAAPSDRQWPILRRQLEDLPVTGARAKSIVHRYDECLQPFVARQIQISSGTRLLRYPLLVKNPLYWVNAFAAEGIEIGRWFDSPISPFPGNPSRFRYNPGQCPVAEAVSRHVINLPLHQRLTDSDVARICEISISLASTPDGELVSADTVSALRV